MLQNLLLIFVFVGLLSTSFSCKVTNDEDTSINVDPIFNLEMVEDLQNNRELSFWVRSIELQECVNFTISYNLEKTTSEINIGLNDIIPPSDCIIGNEPAEAELKLGFLPLGRFFSTEFNLKNTVQNKGKLTINTDAYLLELESMDGLGSVTEKLYKVPNNLIWGYTAYHNDAIAENVATNFQANLSELTSEKTLSTGYYGHFSIAEDAALSFVQNPDFQKVTTFYYNYFGESQELIDLMEDYRSNNNANDIQFKIFTAKGEVF
ncbi:MAG: hypothetical protein ACI9XO_003249 [Paraglaciecola sp.]|jgi:hypothetical protein